LSEINSLTSELTSEGRWQNLDYERFLRENGDIDDARYTKAGDWARSSKEFVPQFNQRFAQIKHRALLWISNGT
jgi:hypothetical protein